MIDFEDPRVQVVYKILCDTDIIPPQNEHWEGWTARLIVDALDAYNPCLNYPNCKGEFCTCDYFKMMEYPK